MSSEERRALRIALSFTGAFIAAELLRSDLELTFLAPLVAASLACGAETPKRVLVALPIVAWLLVAIAGFTVQVLAGKPVVLALLQLWVFWGGFTLLRQPRLSTLGLIILLVFAIVPQTLIKAPTVDADLAYWFGMNFVLAAAADWVMRRLLPAAASERPAMPPSSISPLVAAIALLVAVVMTAVMQLPAPGAIMVGVIIVLRSQGEEAVRVTRDRLAAAFVGGGLALAVWQVIWSAPTLPMLGLAVMLAAWTVARRIALGGTDAALAMKSLNVLAILIGEGFSVFYEDADDRFGTRLVGVIIGLLYVSAVVSLIRRHADETMTE